MQGHEEIMRRAAATRAENALKIAEERERSAQMKRRRELTTFFQQSMKK
jgi:hypothetical protein